MDRKIFILLSSAAVVVVIVLAVYAGTRQPPAPRESEAGQERSAAAGPSATRAAVPAGIAVPGESAANVPSHVAVPKIVAQAAPSSDASYRSFAVRIEKNAFAPDTIIVRNGDSVDIKITSVDKAYSFMQPDFGLKANIALGQTQLVGFSVHATGKFTFYCGTCGGPASGPVGYLIVTPK